MYLIYQRLIVTSPPPRASTINEESAILNVTAAPDLTPIVKNLSTLTVENPLTGAVTDPNPEKLI